MLPIQGIWLTMFNLCLVHLKEQSLHDKTRGDFTPSGRLYVISVHLHQLSFFKFVVEIYKTNCLFSSCCHPISSLSSWFDASSVNEVSKRVQKWEMKAR